MSPEQAPLRVLDLFSGIGGFSLGLERTGGFETVGFCEMDPFCQEVLKKHWRDVPIYEDITNTKFTEDVDLVTAGFPCQDISSSGERAGLSGDRSGLFWYILRTLCMVGRPRVLLENVAELLDRGLSSVLGAMASFGYDAEWHCISACHVGLPHRRKRIFIVAAPDTDSSRELQPGWGIAEKRGWVHDSFQAPLWPLSDETGNIPINGLSQRLLGNAVVPQIPEIIGHAILEAHYENI